jgi:hypothetical protein
MNHFLRKSLGRGLCLPIAILFFVHSMNAADKFIGVWKVNKTKSKYIRDRGPKNIKLKWVPYGNSGVKFSSERFASEGSVQYVAFYDGKDYPVRYAEGYDTVSLKRIDANTVECTYKKNGIVVSTSRRTVSADGASMTVTATGTNADGEAQGTAVYDIQAGN